MKDSDERDEDEAASGDDANAPEPRGARDSTASRRTRGTREAKEELFEAIDHFKNAASILFDRATKDPAVKSATKEAERVVKKIGDAAEPLAKQLTSELGRLTRDVMGVVEGRTRGSKKKRASKKKVEARDEEE